MRKTPPVQVVDADWQEFQAIMGEGELDPKTKELIGLGVAERLPHGCLLSLRSRKGGELIRTAVQAFRAGLSLMMSPPD